MIDGACATVLSTVFCASAVWLAATWVVCSLVVSIVVGFMLHVGRGS